MPRNLTLSGLVLAGGKSRRMGRDKALLELKSTTLLNRTKVILQGSGCQRILISSNEIQGAIKDRFEGYGPVAGIEAVMKRLLTTGTKGTLVILPVDMALITPASIQRLIAANDNESLIRFDGHQFPLLLPVNRQTHQKLESELNNTNVDQGMSIKAMCRLFKSSKIPPDEIADTEFFNCNSPEDFDYVQKLLEL